MEKIWYIFIENKEEGPYSEDDLILDPRVNLDTLVWKEGFESWTPLRKVKGLKKLFEKPKPQTETVLELETKKLPRHEELALDYGKDPNFIFLLLLILALSLYLIFHFS